MGQAATTTNILDWQFSNSLNPASPTPGTTVNPDGGNPVATFSGPNNTYFFDTGPSGLFGPPTGLWDVEAGQLQLSLDRITAAPSDFTVVITQFIDSGRSLYPGAISFSLPGASLIKEVVVVPQSGSMIGSWYADTYQWSQVDFTSGPITLGIAPANAGTGLLLDEVQFSIVGSLTDVPEPRFIQLAGAGLLAFAMRCWSRRKAGRSLDSAR